jgi:DNA-binding MarR family transcriptional regulator
MELVLTRDPIAEPAALVLADFVPFRLNRLAVAVSDNLSAVYRERFGLEIPEWRVLVTVGGRGECSAQHIAASTRMHKTRVSRAVAALEERTLLARALNARDGRELRLHLTKAGQHVYDLLVPLALEREQQLLSCMDAHHRGAFRDALASLELALGLTSDE